MPFGQKKRIACTLPKGVSVKGGMCMTTFIEIVADLCSILNVIFELLIYIKSRNEKK